MAPIPERIASLETQVGLIHADVSEIKTDVKTLLASSAKSSAYSGLLKAIPWAALIALAIAVVHG